MATVTFTDDTFGAEAGSIFNPNTPFGWLFLFFSHRPELSSIWCVYCPSCCDCCDSSWSLPEPSMLLLSTLHWFFYSLRKCSCIDSGSLILKKLFCDTNFWLWNIGKGKQFESIEVLWRNEGRRRAQQLRGDFQGERPSVINAINVYVPYIPWNPRSDWWSKRCILGCNSWNRCFL